MCQMCEEYEAELQRMGIAMDDRITVDLDHELVEELERRAKAHGHGVADEVREIVRAMVVDTAQGIDFVDEFRRIRAMSPTGAAQTDSTEIIRQSRDRDH